MPASSTQSRGKSPYCRDGKGFLTACCLKNDQRNIAKRCRRGARRHLQQMDMRSLLGVPLASLECRRGLRDTLHQCKQGRVSDACIAMSDPGSGLVRCLTEQSETTGNQTGASSSVACFATRGSWGSGHRSHQLCCSHHRMICR